MWKNCKIWKCTRPTFHSVVLNEYSRYSFGVIHDPFYYQIWIDMYRGRLIADQLSLIVHPTGVNLLLPPK
jgi:hypothetical protein